MRILVVLGSFSSMLLMTAVVVYCQSETRLNPQGNVISEEWKKQTPIVRDFQIGGKKCSPTGEGGDPDANIVLNRIDVPAVPYDVALNAIKKLPIPHTQARRASWTSDQKKSVRQYEGIPVRVEGYIAKFTISSQLLGDTANCRWDEPNALNWHLSIVPDPRTEARDSVMTRITARVRAEHKKWDKDILDYWIFYRVPVRVTGWLFFDSARRSNIGLYQATIWEISPITKIELYRDGEWIDFDQIK